jgi:hypothetical protein
VWEGNQEGKERGRRRRVAGKSACEEGRNGERDMRQRRLLLGKKRDNYDVGNKKEDVNENENRKKMKKK